MPSDLARVLSWTLELFQYEFTIYGVTFSMFEVFIFSAVASIIGWFIGKVFFDD